MASQAAPERRVHSPHVETSEHRASPRPDVPASQDPAQLTVKAPHDGELIEEPTPEDLEAGALEERRVPRYIPRVEPRTTHDLPTEAPSKQRYPVGARRALRELWRARELVLGLVERDLRVRYKQAVLGVFWAVLSPLLTMVIFTFVFGHIARIRPPEGVPYPLFAYAALVPWSLFAGATSFSVNAIIANAPIIRKIYCPREVFPIAGVISSGADFLISFVILIGLLLAFGYFPGITWLAVIPLLVVLVMLQLAVAMFFSVAIAYFRDVRYIVPSVIQVLLFVSPIAYPLDTVTGELSGFWQTAYLYANPLAPLMDGFRRALLFGQWPLWEPFASAAAIATFALAFSYWWYKRRDGYLADVI